MYEYEYIKYSWSNKICNKNIQSISGIKKLKYIKKTRIGVSKGKYCVYPRMVYRLAIVMSLSPPPFWMTENEFRSHFSPFQSNTVQITFIFIGQTRLVFGKCVYTCVTKHSNAFRTFLNWPKNSKRVWHEPKLHISRLPLFANFDL